MKKNDEERKRILNNRKSYEEFKMKKERLHHLKDLLTSLPIVIMTKCDIQMSCFTRGVVSSSNPHKGETKKILRSNFSILLK